MKPEAALTAVFSDNGLLSKAIAGYKQRDEQTQLAADVLNAVQEQSILVAEAGTGVGKTFAYLVPSILAGGKTVISTATKTLQDQLFDKDIRAVIKVLQPLKEAQPDVVLLKGRANYVCHFHLNRQLSEGRFPDVNTGAKLRKIREFAVRSDTGDKGSCASVQDDDAAWSFATSTRDNCLGQECPDVKECFVMRARRRALAADIVIVNHHLFCADLALRDEGVAELLPNADTLIFDEAHQLPAICSQFMGQTVSARLIQACLRDALAAAGKEAPEQVLVVKEHFQIEQVLMQIRALWPAEAKSSAANLLANPEFVEALGDLKDSMAKLSACLTTLAVRGPMLERAALRASELLYLLAQWLQPSQDPDKPVVLWAESFQRGWTLHQTPLEVGPLIERQLLNRPRSLIFVSATLSMDGAFTHFTRAMGVGHAHQVSYGSPFNYALQARLLIPEALPEPNAPGFHERLMEKVLPLIVANHGRAFILCTSLRAVDACARFMRANTREFECLVQGEMPRSMLLQQFRVAKKPVLIGSASFWEGVDVVGAQLSLVVIDKLPFAPPDDPVLQARLNAAKQRGDDPFNDYQLPMAAIALKQGAGRLLRSETDRGALVLGDNRLLSRGYGRKVLRSLPAFTLSRSTAEVVEFLSNEHPILTTSTAA